MPNRFEPRLTTEIVHVVAADVAAAGARTLSEIERVAETSLATLFDGRHVVVAEPDRDGTGVVHLGVYGPAIRTCFALRPSPRPADIRLGAREERAGPRRPPRD